MGGMRGFFSQFTTQNISVVKNHLKSAVAPVGYSWGRGLWYNTAPTAVVPHSKSEKDVRMSLHPHVMAPVPEETARVARAAFPKGHPYLTFRDALGTLFQDEDFAPLFRYAVNQGSPRGA